MDANTLATVELPTLLAVVIGVPLALAGYIVGLEYAVGSFPLRLRSSIRPWIWIGPALVFVALFLVYPALGTIWRSLYDRSGATFVGLDNYAAVLGDSSVLIAIRDNLYWLIAYTGFALLFGLLFAVLSDHVRYETLIKSLIFMPMAISFVALAVIWKFMYSYQPPGAPQTGTLNFLLTTVFHAQPVTWLQDRRFNNFALIAAGVWGITGFALVILSAALKGIPIDLMEAARVDGASELMILWRIVLPLLMPTVTVIATTLVIYALKAFDVVYVMTNGNYDTDVLANRMYKLLFNFGSPGRSGAVAVLLLLAVIPVLVFNLRQLRKVEARR